jgi:hypothetical protein
VFVLWDLASCHAVPGEGARKLGLAGDWTMRRGTEVPPKLMKTSGALANQAAAFGLRSARAEPWTELVMSSTTTMEEASFATSAARPAAVCISINS